MERNLTPHQIDTSLDLNIGSFRHLDKCTMREATRSELLHSPGKERQEEKQEGAVCMEDFNRITSEHKKLTQMLMAVREDMHAMQSQLMNIKNSSPEAEPVSRKRKLDCYDWSNAIRVDENIANGDEESYERAKENLRSRSNIIRVFIPTDPSDMSLIVKDGYHWRKYGQKVTRDNPSPRAYFKCSFAPSCPVKKKVQRSAENPSVLEATYDGEHNHHRPIQPKNNLGSSKPLLLIPDSPKSVKSQTTPNFLLDPIGFSSAPLMKRTTTVQESEAATSNSFPQLLVQQMVNSLTRDTNFTSNLAAAISGRILEQEPEVEAAGSGEWRLN